MCLKIYAVWISCKKTGSLPIVHDKRLLLLGTCGWAVTARLLWCCVDVFRPACIKLLKLSLIELLIYIVYFLNEVMILTGWSALLALYDDYEWDQAACFISGHCVSTPLFHLGYCHKTECHSWIYCMSIPQKLAITIMEELELGLLADDCSFCHKK